MDCGYPVGADGKYVKPQNIGRGDWEIRRGCGFPPLTMRFMSPFPVSHKVKRKINV